ncbi:MAG: VanW family protein [Bifidobacteriaceae bacterium]|jgi:vancomycin resistance protein YoaR|nr:VanW family protein [Bifidobacteriaceae bacterium]
MGDTTQLTIENGPRRTGTVIKATVWVVLFAAAVAGYVWLAHWLADRVPAGVSVAGVEISHLTAPEAAAKLEAELGPKATSGVAIVIDGTSAALDPASAGLTFSVAETIAPLTGLSYDPFVLWEHASGHREVAPAVEVDREALVASLAALAEDTAIVPVDGTISVANGGVSTTPPTQGRRLDVEPAADAVAEGWFAASAPLELPTAPVEPTVDEAALERAAAEIAEPLLSGPVTVAIDDRRVELPVTVLCEAASISPIQGTLRLNLDDDVIVEAIRSRLPADIESEAKDAQFVFVDGQPTIDPGTAGRTVDFASITAEVALAAQSTTDRTALGAMREVDPTQSTEMLEQLGIREVVGAAHTQAYADAGRTANLRLASEKVTGVLVKPGETFSLNETLGPRTYENGWSDAGVVEAGVLTTGIGGGLSQFSTTLYNASHLAGMEDVEHQPHQNYFSRYPKGREATLWEGVIDNKFKNNTPYGLLLRAWVTPSLEVNVEVWSTKYWDVESVIGPERNVVPTQTVTKPAGPNCQAQAAGSSGFTVDYTRTLSLDGEVQDTQTWTWTYQPTNKIVCESPEDKQEDD